MQDREPPDFLPDGLTNRFHGIPADARQMGIDRYTEEGAMIAMASSLDGTKRSHRVVAWVILSSFAAPLIAMVIDRLPW
jgi:hypothetical protein